MQDQFETFWRGMTIYVEASTAVISTSPTYTRFGDHSQNAAITAENVAVTPQSSIISGCILYGSKQPWVDFSAGGEGQLKLRDSEGTVRLKVASDGYALLRNCKLINLDGFNFQLDSNARPHGLLGNPTRWTFSARKVD